MGLIDKFKNLFTEEVEEEVVEVKQEPIKIKPEPIKNPNPSPVIKKDEDPIKSENLSLKKEEKFVFPVYFDDKDFDDITKKEEVKPKPAPQPIKKEVVVENYREAYNKKTSVKEEKKIFKPTPIISPVYGILDKNYYKEDIVVSPISRNAYQNTNKSMTIDDVRKKAYGTLEDDLEKSLFSDSLIEDIPKHGKMDDDSIFNELDFANAIEEDKKRDLSKDGLKSDIESLLDNKEFANDFDYHINKEDETNDLDEEIGSMMDTDDIDVKINTEESNDISIDDEFVNDTISENIDDGKIEADEIPIDDVDNDNLDDIDEEIELPNNVSENDEIEKAYSDNSDLNDSDLFNLIDSMYEQEDK